MTQIITFDPALDKNKHLIKKLSDICIEISESNDTLAKNYNNTRFIFTDSIAITIVLNEEDEIIMFATLYQNEFYGNKCARTMNRTWKAPSIRKENALWKNIDNRKFFYGPDIIASHILIAKEKNIDQVFISIEGGAHRYAKYLCPILEEKTGLKWFAPVEAYKVCPQDSLSCWQNILYTNINNNDKPFAFETLGVRYTKMRDIYNHRQTLKKKQEKSTSKMNIDRKPKTKYWRGVPPSSLSRKLQ